MHDSEHPRKLRTFLTEHKFGTGGWWANATIPEALAQKPGRVEHIAGAVKNRAGWLVTYDPITRTYTLGTWGLTLAAAEVELQAAVGLLLPGYHL